MGNPYNRLPTSPVSHCYWRILRNLLPLIVFYLACQFASSSNAFYEAVNGIAPVYFMLALLLPAYRLVRVSPETIWSPAAWLPVSSAIFYGFGPLVSVYGNEATKMAMAATKLAATPADIFRANVLSAVGIFGLMAGFWLHTHYRAPLWQLRPMRANTTIVARLLPLALIFIFGGAFLRYAIIKPAAWGGISSTIPGVITALGPLVDLGFGVLALVLVRRRYPALRIFFWLTWPLHVFLCILSMAKAELIMALLLPALAAYLGHRNRRRLALSFLVMALVFVVAQPWVHYGRGVISAQTGTITQAGYVERTEILGQYLAGNRGQSARGEDVQGWWTRLNYSEVQAYGMRAYDEGLAGSTLKGAWMRFVPRAIWTEKPILVGPGKEFHGLVHAREGTSFLALSVYGDLYWQFGWAGVIAICPLIGWFYGMLAWRSIAIMRQQEFIMLPLVLIAFDAGLLGMNAYLINGIIGIIPIYYAYMLGTKLLVRFFRRSRKRASQGAGGQI